MAEPISGRIPFNAYETWYAVFGELAASKQPPLVVLHGGPGAGHDYLRSLGELSSMAGIPVVVYDQVGCARSTHLTDAPPGTFTIKFFLDELDNLLNALNIETYDLLGQSWGGMLACEHAVRQPIGLRRLILEGCPASVPLAEQVRLRGYNGLPAVLRDALFQHEKDGKSTPEYLEAKLRFRQAYACRLDPMPAELLATWENMRTDPTVPLQMVGSSDFHTKGTLESWSIIGRMHLIKNEVLVANGRYDWCGQEAAEPFKEGKWKATIITLETAAHMAHLDEKDNFFRYVIQFLTA